MARNEIERTIGGVKARMKHSFRVEIPEEVKMVAKRDIDRQLGGGIVRSPASCRPNRVICPKNEIAHATTIAHRQ